MTDKISTRANVATEVDLDKKLLVITINLDESKVAVHPSGSGKSTVIATTGGAINIAGVSINLTVYRK